MNGPQLPIDVAKRPLHFFWLVDWSGSMGGKKIASLNQAIRESVPAIIQATASHPEVQVFMRAIKFADRAEWHVGPAKVELEKFTWSDLSAGGVTAMARAITMLNGELEIEKMPPRGYPPVCILLSDGYCTDPESEYERAIGQLLALPWGKKAVRLAIGIGDESDYDEKQLMRFISHPEIGVLKAHNPQELVQYIKWASVSASVGASVGKSKDAGGTPHVILPPPPPAITTSGDVF